MAPQPSLLVLPRSDSENSATMAVYAQLDADKKKPCDDNMDHRRRRVRFADPSAHQYYEAPAGHYDAATLRNRWYNASDYGAFERETHHRAAMLQTSLSWELSAWTNAWLRVYFTLRLAKSTEEIERVLDETNLTHNETTVGFTDNFLEPIYSDFKVRRESLLSLMHRLQAIVEDPDVRARLLYEASRSHSHATRLYANLVAVVAASSSSSSNAK